MNKRPPKHLGPEARQLWLFVTKTFELDLHHVVVLNKTCEAVDVAETARLRLAKDGHYIVDRFGQTRSHPAVSDLRDAITTVFRGIRELDLDAAVASENRPPVLQRYRGMA